MLMVELSCKIQPSHQQAIHHQLTGEIQMTDKSLNKWFISLAAVAAILVGTDSRAQEVALAKDGLFGNVFDASGEGKTSKSFADFAACVGDWAKSKSSRATFETKEIEGKMVAVVGISRGPVFAAIDSGDGNYKTQFISSMAGRIISSGAMDACK